jgi:CHASE2 domain-containing sensor protein
VPNPAAAAVDVYNAVDFAAALHALVKDWTAYKNIITVDAEAGCVSYQQANDCIIFSCNPPQVQFVEVAGLPPSFIGAEQQVRRDAREMKPDQNTNVQPLAAPTSNRKHASPRLPSSAAPQQPQALLTRFAAPCQSHHVSCVERGSGLPRLRTPNRARALLAAAAATGIQAAAAFA